MNEQHPLTFLWRHETPVQNDLSRQNMQDRYHGNNDPVARKIMATHAENQGLNPPDDQSIVCFHAYHARSFTDYVCIQTSLFLSSLPAEATELSVRTKVVQSLPHVPSSQLKSIVHVAKTRFVLLPYFLALGTCWCPSIRCAFVNFKDRASAERAAEAWANGLDIDGERVGVKWGRSRPAAAKASASSSAAMAPVAS